MADPGIQKEEGGLKKDQSDSFLEKEPVSLEPAEELGQEPEVKTGPERERRIEEESAKTEKEKQIKTTVPQPVKDEAAQAAKKIKGLDKKRQLEILSQMAFEKGIIYAIEVVRRLDNPHLLDAFHDYLIDRLRQELIAKGRLKDI